VRSNFINQEYILQVYLPLTYSDSSKTYPVLYLLDSDKSFGMAKEIVEWLIWSQEIPKTIIVGIAFGEGIEECWQKRSRDYTTTKDRMRLCGDFLSAGGAGDLLRFIKLKLTPLIDAQYRINKNDKAILGLSFGGLFGAYAMLADPNLFSRYFMI